MADPISSDMKSHGYYYFSGDVDPQTIKPVIEWIIEMNLKPEKDRMNHITLIITSNGGLVDDCFALIDTIRGSAIPVHTVGLGIIASCGLLMFMAGSKRYLTPNTSILSHRFSAGSYGKEHELFARQKYFDLTTKQFMRHCELPSS